MHFEKLARNLSNAWPTEKAQGTDGFFELAEQYEIDKKAMFKAAKSPAQLRIALSCANILHGRADHNEKLVRAAAAILRQGGASATLVADICIDSGLPSDRFISNVLEAAGWFGLSDRDIPISVLAAKRERTSLERQNYIDARAIMSTRVYEEYEWHKFAVSILISQIRTFGEGSERRTLAAQFLDLLDRLCETAANQDDGARKERVGIAGMFEDICRNLGEDDVHVAPRLIEEVRACAESGVLDDILRQAGR